MRNIPSEIVLTYRYRIQPKLEPCVDLMQLILRLHILMRLWLRLLPSYIPGTVYPENKSSQIQTTRYRIRNKDRTIYKCAA
jgi:hypothetical protein